MGENITLTEPAVRIALFIGKSKYLLLLFKMFTLFVGVLNCYGGYSELPMRFFILAIEPINGRFWEPFLYGWEYGRIPRFFFFSFV